MNNIFDNKVTLIVVIAVVATSGFFVSDYFVASEEATVVDDMLPEARTKKAGAHDAYDPHASLTPDKHIQVALQHLQEGRLSKAMETLTAAILQYSDNKDLYAVRGSIYLQQQQPAKALSDIQTALMLSPNDSALLTNRAQVYRQFGQIKDALADLDKAIRLSPELVAARFNRGAIYYSSGDYQKALEDFNQCIAIDPHLAGPYFNRASAKHALGDVTGARQDVDRFIQISDSEQWKTTARDLLQRWDDIDAGTEYKPDNEAPGS